MKLRHGTFSYLPDLTDDEIAAQVRYALDHEWPVSIEFTDDPHPRNVYWEMWGLPMFDLTEPDGVLAADQRVPRDVPEPLHPGACVRRRVSVDRRLRCRFLVQSPAEEPGFLLTRVEGENRTQRYAVSSYATAQPTGARYP